MTTRRQHQQQHGGTRHPPDPVQFREQYCRHLISTPEFRLYNASGIQGCGQGAFGTAWRLQHMITQRWLCIKINSLQAQWSQAKNEINIAKLLFQSAPIQQSDPVIHSANLVRVFNPHEVEQHKLTVFFMDFIFNSDFSHHCLSSDPDPKSAAERYHNIHLLPMYLIENLFIQLLLVCRFLHSHRIYHRDIKPDNILHIFPHQMDGNIVPQQHQDIITNQITMETTLDNFWNILQQVGQDQPTPHTSLLALYNEGGELAARLGQCFTQHSGEDAVNAARTAYVPPAIYLPVLKIIDFGLSLCLLNYKVGEADMFHSSVGTPLYQPPEIITPQHWCTPTDLYAVGITICHLLFGYIPTYAYPPKIHSKEELHSIRRQSSFKQFWQEYVHTYQEHIRLQTIWSSTSGVPPQIQPQRKPETDFAEAIAHCVAADPHIRAQVYNTPWFKRHEARVYDQLKRFANLQHYLWIIDDKKLDEAYSRAYQQEQQSQAHARSQVPAQTQAQVQPVAQSVSPSASSPVPESSTTPTTTVASLVHSPETAIASQPPVPPTAAAELSSPTAAVQSAAPSGLRSAAPPSLRSAAPPSLRSAAPPSLLSAAPPPQADAMAVSASAKPKVLCTYAGARRTSRAAAPATASPLPPAAPPAVEQPPAPIPASTAPAPASSLRMALPSSALRATAPVRTAETASTTAPPATGMLRSVRAAPSPAHLQAAPDACPTMDEEEEDEPRMEAMCISDTRQLDEFLSSSGAVSVDNASLESSEAQRDASSQQHQSSVKSQVSLLAKKAPLHAVKPSPVAPVEPSADDDADNVLVCLPQTTAKPIAGTRVTPGSAEFSHYVPRSGPQSGLVGIEADDYLMSIPSTADIVRSRSMRQRNILSKQEEDRLITQARELQIQMLNQQQPNINDSFVHIGENDTNPSAATPKQVTPIVMNSFGQQLQLHDEAAPHHPTSDSFVGQSMSFYTRDSTTQHQSGSSIGHSLHITRIKPITMQQIRQMVQGNQGPSSHANIFALARFDGISWIVGHFQHPGLDVLVRLGSSIFKEYYLGFQDTIFLFTHRVFIMAALGLQLSTPNTWYLAYDRNKRRQTIAERKYSTRGSRQSQHLAVPSRKSNAAISSQRRRTDQLSRREVFSLSSYRSSLPNHSKLLERYIIYQRQKRLYAANHPFATRYRDCLTTFLSPRHVVRLVTNNVLRVLYHTLVAQHGASLSTSNLLSTTSTSSTSSTPTQRRRRGRRGYRRQSPSSQRLTASRPPGSSSLFSRFLLSPNHNICSVHAAVHLHHSPSPAFPVPNPSQHVSSLPSLHSIHPIVILRLDSPRMVRMLRSFLPARLTSLLGVLLFIFGHNLRAGQFMADTIHSYYTQALTWFVRVYQAQVSLRDLPDLQPCAYAGRTRLMALTWLRRACILFKVSVSWTEFHISVLGMFQQRLHAVLSGIFACLLTTIENIMLQLVIAASPLDIAFVNTTLATGPRGEPIQTSVSRATQGIITGSNAYLSIGSKAYQIMRFTPNSTLVTNSSAPRYFLNRIATFDVASHAATKAFESAQQSRLPMSFPLQGQEQSIAILKQPLRASYSLQFPYMSSTIGHNSTSSTSTTSTTSSTTTTTSISQQYSISNFCPMLRTQRLINPVHSPVHIALCNDIPAYNSSSSEGHLQDPLSKLFSRILIPVRSFSIPGQVFDAQNAPSAPSSTPSGGTMGKSTTHSKPPATASVPVDPSMHFPILRSCISEITPDISSQFVVYSDDQPHAVPSLVEYTFSLPVPFYYMVPSTSLQQMRQYFPEKISSLLHEQDQPSNLDVSCLDMALSRLAISSPNVASQDVLPGNGNLGKSYYPGIGSVPSNGSTPGQNPGMLNSSKFNIFGSSTAIGSGTASIPLNLTPTGSAVTQLSGTSLSGELQNDLDSTNKPADSPGHLLTPGLVTNTPTDMSTSDYCRDVDDDAVLVSKTLHIQQLLLDQDHFNRSREDESLAGATDQLARCVGSVFDHKFHTRELRELAKQTQLANERGTESNNNTKTTLSTAPSAEFQQPLREYGAILSDTNQPLASNQYQDENLLYKWSANMLLPSKSHSLVVSGDLLASDDPFAFPLLQNAIDDLPPFIDFYIQKCSVHHPRM